MNLAIGWACNLNDILVRFPYEKIKTLQKFKTKIKKLQKLKQIIRYSIDLILTDIVGNNVTFKLPTVSRVKAEIHLEVVRDSEFRRQYKNGKFKGVDYLESLFTAYQLYLYVGNTKHEKFTYRKKYPIYIGKKHRDALYKHINEGRTYG